MKKLLIVLFLFSGTGVMAQSTILNKLKAKAQEKLQGKSKTENNETDEAQADQQTQPEAPARDTVAAKPENELTAYRQFGFVRGSNIIFEDAFEEDAIGDYPKRWNSDAGGEVVKLSKFPGNWLRGTEVANHTADFLKVLPTNFTLEMDIISDAKMGGDYNELELVFASTKGEKNFSNAKGKSQSSGFSVVFDFFKPWLTYDNFFNFGGDSSNASYIEISSPVQFDLNKFNFKGNPIHVSVVRQDTRLVLYINTTRIFDIRNAFVKNTVLNNLLIRTMAQLEDGSTGGLYFSNVVLAETVSDTRKDLFVDGKYITNSILFETNSDKLQPGSLSAITVVANYLKENPTVKLKVVGHTDNVGEDAANMGLSSRRAASVVKELVDFHKIDASRLSAEGKGETQPIGDNNTREGKAQNRRVEFIKQ